MQNEVTEHVHVCFQQCLAQTNNTKKDQYSKWRGEWSNNEKLMFFMNEKKI